MEGRLTRSTILKLLSLWCLSPFSHGFFVLSNKRHRSVAVASNNVGRLASTSLNLMMLPSHIEQLCSTYTYCLVEHPLATQSATAGLFAGLGDVLAQTVTTDRQETRRAYDPRRTAYFVLKGLGGGIMWNAWFQLSDPLSLSLVHSLFGTSFLGSATAAASVITDPMMLPLQVARVVICILVEQFVVAPLFYTLWDIPIPALLSGSPVRQIPAQISSKLGPLLIANAKLWTPVNLITYNLPTEFRVLFTSCTDLLWQVVCSKIIASDIELLPCASATVDEAPQALRNNVILSADIAPTAITGTCPLPLSRVSSTELRELAVVSASRVELVGGGITGTLVGGGGVLSGGGGSGGALESPVFQPVLASSTSNFERQWTR